MYQRQLTRSPQTGRARTRSVDDAISFVADDNRGRRNDYRLSQHMARRNETPARLERRARARGCRWSREVVRTGDELLFGHRFPAQRLRRRCPSSLDVRLDTLGGDRSRPSPYSCSVPVGSVSRSNGMTMPTQTPGHGSRGPRGGTSPVGTIFACAAALIDARRAASSRRGFDEIFERQRWA